MKTYIMTFDENGVEKFLDPADRAAYKRLLSAIAKACEINGKPKLFKMTIEVYEPRTNDKQISLWNTLISMIAINSGNDHRTVEQTLISQFTKDKITPEQMSNEMFSQLLLSSIQFSQEFFEINIELDDNNHFQIKKI